MTLEELLSDLGTDPLSNKVNGAPLRASINAVFKKLGIPAIDQTTSSEVILEAIYGLEDETVKATLLGKRVSEAKGVLTLKRILMVTAIIGTIIAISVFTHVVRGDHPLTAEEIDLVKSIGGGAFDLVKEIYIKPDAQ
ncbi:virion structural protein [Pseudomonas phage 201phi2-1]|uniref:Virion structural protein n=1 Tax=Pseudomonas phage 201phi2-1 TaxID=198110 RepID=B3FJ89_BP201|nr:virion structural protein [Pseudomonas phage 201phi2-1]ABY63056.1 virion structural protein [Pseudomonas phage 201phi2-1]